MFDPKATYRIQFHSGFTFSRFERIIPYLHQLGVSTIYASPVFKAVPGSTHGYDATNPNMINPEIGVVEQLKQLRWQLRERGINWVQDIVPNHMAFDPTNDWLMDVLEKGQRSVYAPVFDIGWDNSDQHGQIMVPFLGATLADVIKNKELKILYKKQRLHIGYYDNAYPLQPASYLVLLEGAEAPEKARELISEFHDFNQLKDPVLFAERCSEWQARLASIQREREIKTWLAERLVAINNSPEIITRIAGEQYFRLCHWQETDQAINYRRFFTVNGLICVNIQNEQVFHQHHQLVKTLLDEDVIQGIRIDHIDGLYDPTEYLHRLRSATGNNTYTVVEKILAPEEDLPRNWPVQGTSGYEFLAMVNNVLTQQKSAPAFTRFYFSLVKEPRTVSQQMRDKKAHILYEHMGGELENLVRLFTGLNMVSPEMLQQVPVGNLKKAIGEFLVYCPVYRYYGNSLPFGAVEANAISYILDIIKQSEPELESAIGLLEHIWLHMPHDGNEEINQRAAHFYKRCMQFSGPLMAKGVEDTLMYTFNRFVGHNEVGDAADAFGFSIETFHEKMKDRQQRWPLSLNATSTHDTKRGEDARARLNVLTIIPGEWLEHVESWQQLNAPLKETGAPDPNDEYFIYQTIMGTYPMPGDEDPAYGTRLQEYLQKALREAKRHSNWTTPDESYESACKNFAMSLLNQRGAFWKSFSKLHKTVADYGILNSLVQVVLKFTCPGVPDTYQGCEMWDLSFVDPDNRRPVPFEKLQQLLEELDQADNTVSLITNLWRDRFDGRIKLWLVHTLLKLRNRQPELFNQSDYVPLAVEGAYKDNVLAFARRQHGEWIVVAVPLHVAEMCSDQKKAVHRLDWKDTKILLPREVTGKWRNELLQTKGSATKALSVEELFKPFPMALLHMQGIENKRGAGVLLHITSLPSAFGIGDLGPEAYTFADFLHSTRQKYWQLLPVNPVEAGQGYSPYSATSSKAGNTWMISPELLAKDGLLPARDLAEYHLPHRSLVDYPEAEKVKLRIFDTAWKVFRREEGHHLQQAFLDFCDVEHEWLHDFALYTVAKQVNAGKPWYEWDEGLMQREPGALDAFTTENVDSIEMVKWLQFIFSRQWHALRDYCNSHNIQLIGDLPFYISYDSADVWSNKEIFAIDNKGQRTGIAGVPPDAFSDDGQLWGMPVFKWDVLKENGYDWWIKRLQKNKEMFDLVRLDHFRAFSDYWEVPAGEKTARNGQWKPGPGAHFFDEVSRQLGELPFLAEDLGEIDQPVFELRDQYHFPGMKILQFAFGGDFATSDYIPHNYVENFFAYTGTHDNNTTRGWFRQEAGEPERRRIAQYVGQQVTDENVHRVMGQLAYASVANTVILPLQDVLGLDETARMNTPSSGSGNWNWRLLPKQISEHAESLLKEWTYVYNRR
ncbi:malto-oligosyltrehalose synthase [Segetibacter sp. 3557_3]|uniref:malto-oligosyltrehalose synthase n=1 Tax=Segetibacter sp. 3557_3 TaxID=2547429 RepID=UPI00105858B2|nr:malto-oligosyltrehalose synthase [Segetibacter sp. 3557_3]TDH21562.1 malto-oligosyltrehalose synthase [Segetibacter sp. 3557_3]